MSAGRKRVVFLGTPACAARSLELLIAAASEGRADFELVAVVSTPPVKQGRKMRLTNSPVQVTAEAAELPVLTPPNAKDEAFLAALAELQPDLCITAAYGCFLPQTFLDMPKFGTLNIHPSLLPLYRGTHTQPSPYLHLAFTFTYRQPWPNVVLSLSLTRRRSAAALPRGG